MNASYMTSSMMKFVWLFMLALFTASVFLLLSALPAHAAITIQGPPIDTVPINATVTPGALIPLAQFFLSQSSGTDTLISVRAQINSTTTSNNLTNGEVYQLVLYKESGANHGFQPSEDTALAGATANQPATGTAITFTPTTAETITSSGSEYYIVAKMASSSVLVNHHRFDASMPANWLTTSAGALGDAFNGMRKFGIEQAAPLKISEVKVGTANSAADEFVELYNAGEVPIDLSVMPLVFNTFYAEPNGSSSRVALTYYKSVIPRFGYFLIGSQSGYSGSVQPDAIFATTSLNVLVPNGGLVIATSTAGVATSSRLDMLGWGTQGIGNCENTDTSGTECAPALANDGSSLERIARGYPDATSTAASMAVGGLDATKGNGVDLGDNSAEFVPQTIANPQNSLSPIEFPFAGGFQDMSNLQVTGSYPGPGSTNVPVDLAYVGFGFNKPVASTTIVSGAATTTVSLVTGGGSNLCTSVTYNPFPGNFEPSAKCNLSAQLTASANYTFTVTTDVRDQSGNRLDQDGFQAGNQNYVVNFTTGGIGQTQTNTTPPAVVGTSPFPGAVNIPTNMSKIVVEFSQNGMKTSTFNTSNITLSGATLSGFSFSTSSGKALLSINTSALAADTNYTLTISTGVQNNNSVGLPGPYVTQFFTGSNPDTSAPTVIGTLPALGATNIPVNTNDFMFTFDDNMDSSTATSGSVTLGVVGGANLPGIVRYSPIAKEGRFIPNNVLPASATIRLTLVGASLKNLSGTPMAANFTRDWTVESTNTDSTAPAIMHANVDNFAVAISFDEAVNKIDAETLANFTLTVGGVSQVLSALAGHQIVYDPEVRTSRIEGLPLTSGASFTVTANNIKDISGNVMTTASSFTGTVMSISNTGGFIGPGSFSGDTMGGFVDFSASGIGFMPPVSVSSMSPMVNASTTYTFEIPIATQIPADGTIVITFPSSSDFGLCCAATTTANNPFVAEQNKDINGPGPGLVGVKVLAKNTTAKTLTLTLDTGTRLESGDAHDFLRFALADIKNASIPKSFDSSGYTLDIKSKNASGVLLETFTANPIYLGGGGVGGGATTTIRGVVSGNGGNLQGATVHLMSPQTGPIDATTDANGLYQFTGLPVQSHFLTNNFGGGGEYYLFTDPLVKPTGTTTAFFGDSMPTPVQATSTSLVTRNFSLTPTTTAISLTIKLTAGANTFTATENIDIFAGGPGQFMVQTATPGAGVLAAATQVIIPLPASNGFWGVGIGPAMPKSMGMGMMMPPPMPTWSMPKPVEVSIMGCPGACTATVEGLASTTLNFNILSADKRLIGVLKDPSGNAMAQAMIFAHSPSAGIGYSAQTSATGTFVIFVTSGRYNVGSYIPGMGQSKQVPVEITSSGNFVDGSPTASTGSTGSNPFVLKMSKPGFKITGRVSDGSSPVSAPVFAYRTDAPGHADAMSNSSTGNYELYVDNGTWKVGTFIPSFGPMAEQTVTVAGADQSNINFAPTSNLNFSILSGNVYEDTNASNGFNTGEGVSGVVIRVSGSSGFNEGVSGSDGLYSVRVPSGTGYSIAEIFKPGYGRLAALKDDGTAIGTINLTASTTQTIKIPLRRTVTINIKDSNGNLLVVPKAFIDLFDVNTRQGNHVEITNASSTTLLIPNGASTTIRAFVHGIPSANISVASDDLVNTLVLSGVLQVNGAEAVKITVNTATAALSEVRGTVYHTSATAGNEIADAWIEFVDTTNNVHFGTAATSSGFYSIKAADGTYNAIVSAPRYVSSPVSVSVSGATTQNFVLSASDLTIQGRVTAGGAAAVNAFVRAEKVGGGETFTQADTSGNYTLYVTSGTWRVFAVAEGYAEGAYTANPLSVTSSQSSINITLSTAFSLQSKLAQSNTFTDSSAASFDDSTVGVAVNLDANALGSAGNSSYITAKETNNFPQSSTVNLIGNKAKDINAFSGGSQVKQLGTGKKASVDLTYTKAELAVDGIDTTTEVDALEVVTFSDNKWESLSSSITYKDSAGAPVGSPAADLSNVSTVTFTAITTHFSAFALSDPSDPAAPSTPSGVTVGSQTQTSLDVSWTANAAGENVTGYFIYRDTNQAGSFALLRDNGNTTSYTNTGLDNGTTYYYKVAAYRVVDTSTLESAASSAVSGETLGSGGGAPGTVSAGGGGGGAPSVSLPPEPAPAPSPAGELPTPPAQLPPQAQAAVVSPVFNRNLAPGSKGEDVTRLQELLKSDSELYPEGLVTGYYGSLTTKAVGRFQLKYKVVSSVSDAGYGLVGPKTRAKLAEVFAQPAAPQPGGQAAPELTPPAELPPQAQAAVVSPVFNRTLTIGSTGEDVKRLQQLLNSDPDMKVSDSGVGSSGNETNYFGSLTQKAVQKFQAKYGVVSAGTPQTTGYGLVGPKTRAKLSEVFAKPTAPQSGGQAAPAAPAPAAATQSQAEIEAQIQQILKQIQDLQKQIQGLQ